MDLSYIAILMLAAFVHGALGFGFPLVSTPLLVLLMDMRLAIQLTLLPTIAVNISSLLNESRWRIAVKDFWLIPVFTVIGSFAGTRILLTVDPEHFRLLLALMLLGYLLVERKGQAATEGPRQFPQILMIPLGLVLGFLAGVTNVFSPLLIVFALYYRIQPALLVALFNVSFLTSKMGQVGGFALNQALSWEIVRLSLFAMPLVLLSLWLGMRIRKKLSPQKYIQLLKLSLLIMSLGLIIDWALR